MLLKTREKIYQREALSNRVADERQAGNCVVFTNGCFDLLHVGHVRYLQQAAKEGKFLIVAINDDEGVRREKGAGRPILPQQERATALAALSCVDAVTIFEEETPRELLKLLKPDVLVKGGDYGVEGIVGREVVWEYGGEVKPLCVTQGLSTSDIITRCL